MKKNKKYIVAAFVLAMLCTTTSCKKLVEVGAPTNALVTSSVFNNDATAITAQLAVYANLEVQLGANFEIPTGLSSDELTNYSTNQFKIDAYTNNLSAVNDGSFNGTWGLFYGYIYQENAILENVSASVGMSDRVKQLMTGEALFMRAYTYFQLVNMFGDVPLITQTDYSKNSTLPRTPKDQVYAQMVDDLTKAQGLLSPTYLDASDNSGVTARVRPTTWAADALLARVYLYMGKYDLAEQQASLVIANSTMFSLVTDLNQVFKINSKEAIWQLTPPTGQLYTNEGRNFILTTPPPSSSLGQVAISPQLLNVFEPNDNRRTNWVGSYSQSGTTWYFPYKYKDNNSATSLSEYSMVLRLAEQYLIRSEARAQQGKVIGANSAEPDLNAIRNRAGLPNTTASNQAQMLSAIARERQVELFTEYDRWFDLKRTKAIDATMSIVTPQKGGSGWNSYQQFYPLEPTDLQLNPNLIQNPGY
ncbi:MAG: RagB/SusD family nutrient uptake outer membrane protein [Bacteroidota bacterium]